MRVDFVPQNDIKLVLDGFDKLYEHMITTGKMDAEVIKEFMEPYFKKAGYRESVKQKGKTSNKNILIIHDAGIGDFIIMSAVIREIRRIYQKAHITLLVSKMAVSLAENCPYVDDLVIINKNLWKLNDFFRFYKTELGVIKDLLKRRLDISFSFGQYPSSQLIAYMSGAKERVEEFWFSDVDEAFKLGCIPMSFFAELATSRNDFKKLRNPHFNECCINILQSYSKNNIKNKKIELWLSPMDNFVAETFLQLFNGRKIYALVMGSNKNLHRKRWNPENYAKLLNMILKHENTIFVILGGAYEIEEGNIVASLVNPENLVNLTNKLTLRQSIAVLNLCDCYIGNDTGMMHAAAALNIPVLSPNCFPMDLQMIPSSAPQKYYPYDVPSVIVRPVHALSECKNSNELSGCMMNEAHCISQITPEKMFEAFGLLKKQIAQNAKEPLFFS